VSAIGRSATVAIAARTLLTTSGQRWAVGARLIERIPAGRLSTVAMINVYLTLLLGLPSALVVRQIGAAGTPANLWGLLLLLWWTAMTVAGHNPQRTRNPVRVALALLVLAVLVSYAAAMSRGWYAPPDVRQATDDVYDLVPASSAQIRAAMMSAADRGLISFFSWMGVALVAVDGLRTWRDLERCIGWLVSLTTVIAAVGVAQYFTGLDISPLFRIPGLSRHAEFGQVFDRSVLRRVMATATHPIEFGVLVAGVFPLALHRAIYAERRRRARLCAATIGFAVALSVSRSAVLVVGIALVILYCGWPPAWRRVFKWATPAAVVAIRVAAPGVVGTIRSLFLKFGQDNSVTGRTEDYGIVFRVFGDNPVFGRGLYTFVPRYYRILDNQLLMFLLELGVVGTLVFIGCVVTAFVCLRGTRRRSVDPGQRHLALALSASLAGVLVSYATFDALSYAMVAGFTFLLFGAAGAAWPLAAGGEPIRRGGPPLEVGGEVP
jgi:hypothetical protein